MDIDKIVEKIGDMKRPATLGVWKFLPLGNSGVPGYYFTTTYEITRVVRENQRITIFISVELIDSWETFQQTVKRIFPAIVKRQMTDQIPGIEDLLNVVIIDEGELL